MKNKVSFIILFGFFVNPPVARANIFHDISKGANAVSKGITHVVKESTKVVQKTTQEVKNGVGDVAKGADHLGHEVEKGVAHLGHETEKVIHKTGHEVENGVHDAGHGAEHLGQQIGKGAETTLHNAAVIYKRNRLFFAFLGRAHACAATLCLSEVYHHNALIAARKDAERKMEEFKRITLAQVEAKDKESLKKAIEDERKFINEILSNNEGNLKNIHDSGDIANMISQMINTADEELSVRKDLSQLGVTEDVLKSSSLVAIPSLDGKIKSLATKLDSIVGSDQLPDDEVLQKMQNGEVDEEHKEASEFNAELLQVASSEELTMLEVQMLIIKTASDHTLEELVNLNEYYKDTLMKHLVEDKLEAESQNEMLNGRLLELSRLEGV